MARARTHTLTIKHLAILQWFDKHAARPESPDGWCSEKRVEHGVRISGQKMAIGEELHDLTIKLNATDDPFIIVHPSGKHYRLSGPGRKIARTCEAITRTTTTGAETQLVVDRRTKRPPIIRVTDEIPTVPDDLDDDDLPGTEPEPEPAEPETVTLMSPSVEDEDLEDGQADEINDDPPAIKPAKKPKQPQQRAHERAAAALARK